MKLLIEIPKEFEEHFNMDRFHDSLERIRVDIECARISYPTMAGNYELELIKMLRDAITKGEVIRG